MRRAEGGFTIDEILVVLVVLGAILGVTGTVLVNARATVSTTNACADGVRGLHRALERIEADLRGASRVESGPAGEVRLPGQTGPVEWRLEKGVLLRRSTRGRERIASGLSSFRVAGEDGMWRITLDLAGHGGEGRPRAGVTTLVALRAGEESR